MATIGDYVTERISLLRLPINTIGVETLFLKAGLPANQTMTLENIETLDIALLNVIPELLLIPDKKQGDSAITWDKDAIINYYNIRTAELGLPNLLEESDNSIHDISNIW